jgi:hypothetical protein
VIHHDTMQPLGWGLIAATIGAFKFVAHSLGFESAFIGSAMTRELQEVFNMLTSLFAMVGAMVAAFFAIVGLCRWSRGKPRNDSQPPTGRA